MLPSEKQAPDYLTCNDTDIDKVVMANSNVRICLDRDYTANELASIRKTAIDKGALSVKWMKSVRQDDTKIVSTGNKTDVFAKWLEFDKPIFNLDELKSINNEIISIGSDKIAESDIENA